MKYDFDNVIDRRDTYSIKYDLAGKGMAEDVIPLWIADMDFQSPPCVIEALAKCVEHGIFGYSKPYDDYYDIVKSWYKRRFNWTTEQEWVVITSGVVVALHNAVNALSEPGDGVVIQQPVYHPFETAVTRTGRKLLVNNLVYENSKYSIDFDDFEEKIRTAKLFILCNPHNPVSRVWTLEELTRMGEICVKHGVIVIADEIHQDFIYQGHRHYVFADIDPGFADITVTCTSPSKTFNIAGIPHSNIFIKNKELRKMFKQEHASNSPTHPGIMSFVSCMAAYEKGEDWLEELLVYLAGNMALIRSMLEENTKKIKLIEPEGTYLAWLDCTDLGLEAKELDKQIIHKAKLWLCGGAMFGAAGEGFQRVNAACPQSVLKEAIDRLLGVC